MVNYFYLKSKPKTNYCTKTRPVCFIIGKKFRKKFDEILDIENEDRHKWLEKIIEFYVPIPPEKKDGKFIPVYWGKLRKLLKRDPHIYMVSLHYNKTIGPYIEAIEDYNKEKINWDEFKKVYLERLEKEDAQQKIKELKKLSENRDIYIISMEDIDDESTRKIFCDYVNKGE